MTEMNVRMNTKRMDFGQVSGSAEGVDGSQ